jgi:hypothetical protein
MPQNTPGSSPCAVVAMAFTALIVVCTALAVRFRVLHELYPCLDEAALTTDISQRVVLGTSVNLFYAPVASASSVNHMAVSKILEKACGMFLAGCPIARLYPVQETGRMSFRTHFSKSKVDARVTLDGSTKVIAGMYCRSSEITCEKILRTEPTDSGLLRARYIWTGHYMFVLVLTIVALLLLVCPR